MAKRTDIINQRAMIAKMDSEIQVLKAKRDSSARHLEMLESSCGHKWSEPEYIPTRTEGYTIPADPIGTMGVDWRGAVEVPPEIKPRWKRYCLLCDKEEITTKTEVVEVKMAKF